MKKVLITLEDDVYALVKAKQAEISSGATQSGVINEALKVALKKTEVR